MPDDFWRLTPREFDLLHDGFCRREDRAWEKVATLGLWLLAPHTKKKLTVPQLLGRGRLQTLPPRPAAPDTPAPLDDAAIERARVLAAALAWVDD